MVIFFVMVFETAGSTTLAPSAQADPFTQFLTGLLVNVLNNYISDVLTDSISVQGES